MFSVIASIHSGFLQCQRIAIMTDSLCFLLQTLDSILNVEMVKEKSAEEITQVMDLNGINFASHLCLIVIYM